MTTFADLGLQPGTLKALDAVGYESPSPIQAATIPPLLAGRDVVGLAQTGTGKTAAFALPIVESVDVRDRHVQALVLAPTRELAIQVCEAFEKYSAHRSGFHVLPIYGGQGYGVQLSALRRGVHVVVGTPGRVVDHLERGTLDLSGLRHLVLDEADEMLTMGFADELDAILSRTPADKQVALFSATMAPPIRKIAKRHLNDPVEVAVAATSTLSPHIAQRHLIVAHRDKVDALTRLLEVLNFDGLIAFVRTKQATEELAEKLQARGFSAVALNGDVAQNQRERIVGQFREGKVDVLVATDVAARGLDVERVSHVVNVDIPTDPESYTHRIGRTGRAGRSGEAISFVTPRERGLLGMIERATKAKVEEIALPSVDEVNSTRMAKFFDAITAAMEHEQFGFYRDAVARYARERDVPEADVAAALAVMGGSDDPLLLEPEPPRAKRERAPRDDDQQPSRPRKEWGERAPQGSVRYAPYRIAVGRRHKVQPRMIVGALANEGGLGRDDFGKIDIQVDHSIVELPADLSPDVIAALADTRISGRLIEIRPWTERPRRGRHDDGASGGGFGGRVREAERPGPRKGFGKR